jgi:hypothetical protein
MRSPPGIILNGSRQKMFVATRILTYDNRESFASGAGNFLFSHFNRGEGGRFRAEAADKEESDV